jgi:hypothetical protein
MSNQLFLHLGFGKTGTTSFQATCAASQEILHANGIHYPIFEQEKQNNKKRKIVNHSIPIYSLFTSNPSNYHINKRWGIQDIEVLNSAYREQLERALASSSKLIISGENIAHLSIKELESFCKLADSYNFVVNPFAVVRSPFDQFCSLTQQIISGGIYRSFVSLGDLVPPQVPDTGIQEIANQINNIVKLSTIFDKNITFIPFLDACSHRYGIIGYLLETLIGLDPLVLDNIEQKRFNDSRSNLWIRVQNQINKLEPIFANGKLNPNHFKAAQTLSKAGDKFLFTEQEFECFRDLVVEVEDRFSALMLDKFVSKERKFSLPISNSEILNILVEMARD